MGDLSESESLSTVRCSLVFKTLRWWAPLIFMVVDSNPQSDDYSVLAIPVCVVIPVGWMGAADS